MKTTDSNIPNVFDLANDLESLMMEESGGMGTFRPVRRSHTQLRSGAANCEFPKNLLIILRSLGGNLSCIDCGSCNTPLEWASAKFGTLMCKDCAFSHIATGFGDNCTSIRSLGKHSWKLQDILALLEGGNDQFSDYVGLGKEKDQATRRSSYTDSSTTAEQFTIPTKLYRRSSHGSPPENPPTLLGTRRSSLFSSLRIAAGVITKAGLSTEEGDPFNYKYKGKLAKEYEKVLLQRVEKVNAVYRKNISKEEYHVPNQFIEEPLFRGVSTYTGFAAHNPLLTTNKENISRGNPAIPRDDQISDDVSSMSSSDSYLESHTENPLVPHVFDFVKNAAVNLYRMPATSEG